jgi:hypothetical protein
VVRHGERQPFPAGVVFARERQAAVRCALLAAMRTPEANYRVMIR